MTLEARLDRREPRVPFFAPAVASGLSRCWTTNISSGGIGLSAFLTTPNPPALGEEIEIEIMLGERKHSLCVSGRVAWIGRLRPDGRLELGAQFTELAPGARAMLAMFLAEHRPRVLVALATPEEQQLAHRALDELHLDVVDSPEHVDADTLRACASMLVFSSDAGRVTEFMEAISERTGKGPIPGDIPLAPITLCGDLDSELIVTMFTDGKVYQVLRPPFDQEMLSQAIQRSCERWALQLELRWASLQLEGLASMQKLTVRNGRARTLSPHISIVRESAAMQRVYELIATVAVYDVPVLLTGETGTGKELAAQEIHALSNRASTPFVAQDCGALTETLLESELFGHVRGAFTGAAADHPGLFQIADGGTIFLDEIQNTSPGLQAKLLRVVEQGEVRPVGSPRSRRVDVRLIAASNVDLRQASKDGRFRADFFYRLNRFPIEIPALRDHRDDIVPLTRFFLERLCEGMGRTPPAIVDRVEQALIGYDWPGNIRELKNTIERVLLLTPPGEPLSWDSLPAEVRGGEYQSDPHHRGLDDQLATFERTLIRTALDRHDGVIRRAARELAVNAVTLSRKMRRLGLL